MKRRQTRATVLITMLVLSAFLGQAQKYDSALAQLDANYPQEKLYLHFDKSAYNPGETIWFKAYVQVGNNASPFSRNLYSELLNEKGELLQRHITPIIKAGAASSFEIPASITDSIVFVRAYTRWMLNFDSAFLYTKTIPVLSVRNPSTAVAKKTVTVTKLSFFPEGGDLVAGVQSRVAFKATDGNGMPVTIAGDITDSKGKKHTSFTTQHDGMGLFNLTPDLGETYTASFKDAAGKLQQVKLPAIQKTGLVLEINNVDGGLQFIVRRNAAATEVPSVVLVAQSQQQMLYQAKVNLTRSAEVKAVIPGDILPTGITQVTVFSEEGKPLAERIAFVNHQDYYFITDLNIPLKGTDKRARNVIQIDVPDTVECNLSISVTDATINPPHESDQDIYSHLLLASDIRGYVHNPGYYFSSESESVSRNLDLVMMTNGWRRFKWEDILADKWPVIKHPVEDYLTINGSVMGLSKSELTQKELTGIFTLKNGSQQVMVIPVSTEGKFSIPGLIFYDTAKMYYQFNNDQNKILSSKALINIKGDFLQVAPSFKAAAAWTPSWRRQDSSFYRLNRDMARKNIMQEEERRKVQTLAGVTVVARTKSKKEKMDEEYASGFFKGQDGYTFIMEDDPTANSAMSVFQYLQGKVAGLQITGAGQNTQLSWRGGSPSLFLNEMQSQMDVLQNTSMSDVAMIKVFRPPFFGGTGGGGGAIAVYTKKGAAANDNVKGLDFTNVPGYLPEKQFYSPDYSKVEPEHSNEDNRPTLFWNPNVFTDRNNRRIFYDVYNNDISKRLRIVVEGVNAQGKLTRIEKIIE
ncbi:hypothetical protein MD537_08975 [Flavihumibacter sediminis]|nr:hypothetical protein [Flavihumibacter sediminis]